MREKLELIGKESLDQIANCQSLEVLDKIQVATLGKKGQLTGILKGMGKLSPEEGPKIGALVNEVRARIEEALVGKKEKLEDDQLNQQLNKEWIDISLDKKRARRGHIYPLSQTKEELEDLFIRMGFIVYEGPEIESAVSNFDALNVPMSHPSRDKTNTFYIDDTTLLRTQTSPVQIRAMKELGAPPRMICSGRVFCPDDVDDTHSPMFHQLESLVVDEKVSTANLIHTLDVFIHEMFGQDMQTRYRPHYFPFTEPSTEADVTCHACHGAGCKAHHGTGWSMELLGADVVHPNVLRNCGIDPEEYSGFSFGMGADRIAMVKYGISDIRLLFDNGERFLNQF